jgi:hypothetical protein
VSYKAKHNSLRCKLWDVFARRKLAWLKDANFPGKSYIINGYKIILKAATNLAIIEAPPGIAIFQNKRSSYTGGTYDPDVHADPVEIYYCDMFGYGAEYPVQVDALQSVDESYPSRFDGAGWRGQFALFPGGRDAMVLFAGLQPAKSEIWTSHFSSLLVEGLQTVAVGKILETLARLLTEPGTQNSTICSISTVEVAGVSRAYFTQSFDRAGNYYGFTDLFMGAITLAPLPYTDGFFDPIDYTVFPIPTHVPPHPSNYWASLHAVCNYTWQHNGKIRTLWGLDGGISQDHAFFLFTDTTIDDDLSTLSFTYSGWSSTKTLYDLDPDLFYHPGTGDYNFGYTGVSVMAFTPAQLPWDTFQCKNVVFPRPDGTAVLFHYDQWDVELTPDPLIIHLTLNDTPSYVTNYAVPYTGSRNAFPMSAVVDSVLDLHLYWEEVMYGSESLASEYTNVENLHYGTPLNGTWTAFPSLPAGVVLMSFQVIEFTALVQIILGVGFKAGDDGGTCVVLFDSTRNAMDWIVGPSFESARLERSCATVFGDHPYVEKRKRYPGTVFAWSFFHNQWTF